MKNRLEISDLSLAYGKRTILEHISFTLAAGEAEIGRASCRERV